MLPHQSGGEVEEVIELQLTLSQAEISPITWVPNWGSTHGAGTSPGESPRLWAPRTIHAGQLGVQEVSTWETQED